jgi:hypothetical protein
LFSLGGKCERIDYDISIDIEKVVSHIAKVLLDLYVLYQMVKLKTNDNISSDKNVVCFCSTLVFQIYTLYVYQTRNEDFALIYIELKFKAKDNDFETIAQVLQWLKVMTMALLWR